METAVLVSENLAQFCPATHHYSCSDGRWLLVTVVAMDVPETLGTFGVRTAISRMEVATRAAVFLSDEDGTVLDSDGDPANGMTPIGTFDLDSHEAALLALGYELIGDH
ncbi:MAG: hypothetical protein PGN30_10130 [Mycolicibacterium neoaurum]|uniref:DUF7572 family protein n=1 Tax=Mycolicibacterium neoaurum TaxID=1795 RepID=UPI002FFAFF58